jgi:hypothetical protein
MIILQDVEEFIGIFDRLFENESPWQGDRRWFGAATIFYSNFNDLSTI